MSRSLLPVFESLVSGSITDYDYDIFDKRSLRARSELPPSAYLRGRASVSRSMIQRAASVARDIIEEPELITQYSGRDYVNTSRDIQDRNLYSANNFANIYNYRGSNEPGIYSFKSSYGYTIPLYRRRYPSSYLYSSPSYAPSLPWRSDYNSAPAEDLYGSVYGYRRDPYISSYQGPYVGQGRIPFRDWRTESAYRSFSPYRPRHIYPTVRSSYLYPKYV